MPAFLCSDLHTVTVAAALVARGIAQADLASVSMSLRDANNRSLAARYGAKKTPLGSMSRIRVCSAHLIGHPANTLARSFLCQCVEDESEHPCFAWLNKLIEATGGEGAPLVDGLWSI